jgi:xanthine phosphoribosyltransferase
MSLPQRQSCDYWKFAHAGLCGPARGFLSLAAGFIPAVYFIMFLEEAMQELKDRIVKEGKILPGNIVKVDGFLNHRVDCAFMGRIADEFKKYFDLDNVDLILTAEASGIALSAICAYRYGKPMVYAKKAKSDNIEGGLYQSEIFSYTYKKKVTLLVSKEWIHPGDRVLVIDDFLARGEALRGLCEIVQAAGAELVGIGCAVEKGFQGGGDKLRAAGVNLHSLAIIESAEPGNIVFREEA